MRSLNRAMIFRFKGIFRLSMWLLVVGLVTAGSLGCFAGGGAQIRTFKVEPSKLTAGGFARYEMEVSNATDIVVTEGTNVIYLVKGPAVSTYKAAFNGLKTSATQARGSNALKTILAVSNGTSKDSKTLEIPFATVLALKAVTPPVGQSGSDSGGTTSKSYWLPPTSSAAAPQFDKCDKSSNSPPIPDNSPGFAPCPSVSDYCLKSEEAAQLGYTKTSEDPCLYTQDKDQTWYCYKEPAGYCCRAGQSGQAGQVTEATKTQCEATGGDYWSRDEGEAKQACQATGYCCRDGQIGGPMTEDQCFAAGGSVWSTDQGEVMQKCEALGYCCRDGQVGRATQNQCDQMGGAWSTNQGEVMQACQPCYCCTRAAASPVGRIRGDTPGQVTQTTPGACAAQGGSCYNSMEAASQACGAR